MSPPSARAGALMALVSMSSAQLGIAGSVGLIGRFGAPGAASLRLFCAGLIMLAVTRPWRLHYSRAALRAGIVLGLATAGMSILFMCAAARLPLGTASALEFLGPLTVAVCGNGGRALLWPALAGGGVLLLTEPWSGAVNGAGIAFALGAATCYAGYILFTRRIGEQASGIAGLGISMPVAAVAAAAIAGPSTAAKLNPELIAIGIGLACLVPVTTFILELHSLRHLSTAAFSTLVCLEPAIGTIVGLVLLRQVPHALTVAGILCVVGAGAGAVRSGAREHPGAVCPRDPVPAAGPG
ncbi:MAG TPA: EamA family transporter [Trebonia sp.]|nr:EamA family transporter [Trebonia sp.]